MFWCEFYPQNRPNFLRSLRRHSHRLQVSFGRKALTKITTLRDHDHDLCLSVFVLALLLRLTSSIFGDVGCYRRPKDVGNFQTSKKRLSSVSLFVVPSVRSENGRI